MLHLVRRIKDTALVVEFRPRHSRYTLQRCLIFALVVALHVVFIALIRLENISTHFFPIEQRPTLAVTVISPHTSSLFVEEEGFYPVWNDQ